jgi:hypothetical protein
VQHLESGVATNARVVQVESLRSHDLRSPPIEFDQGSHLGLHNICSPFCTSQSLSVYDCNAVAASSYTHVSVPMRVPALTSPIYCRSLQAFLIPAVRIFRIVLASDMTTFASIDDVEGRALNRSWQRIGQVKTRELHKVALSMSLYSCLLTTSYRRGESETAESVCPSWLPHLYTTDSNPKRSPLE